MLHKNQFSFFWDELRKKTSSKERKSTGFLDLPGKEMSAKAHRRDPRFLVLKKQQKKIHNSLNPEHQTSTFY